jgi:DNA-binding response OmpR family regulator
MNIEVKPIEILLINDNGDDVIIIKDTLEKNMRVPWHIVHCENIKEALPRTFKADVIILDLGLHSFDLPNKIFEDIEGIASDTPIIVLTGAGKDEFELATIVMEMGAADQIIRGKFGRLVDAIEFSLIRQKITTDKKEKTDRTLEEAEMKAKTELQDAQDKANIALEESESKRKDEHKQDRQILSLFMGGYSVVKSEKVEEPL